MAKRFSLIAAFMIATIALINVAQTNGPRLISFQGKLYDDAGIH